jgi:transcriptional regulator of acetoin/glycerol metabolism
MIIAEWVPEVEGNAAELRHIQAKASYYLTNEPGHSRPIMSEDQAQRPRTGALRSVKMEAGKAVLMMALDKSKWQIAPAARMLGICRPTVYGMIKAYGLVKPSNIRPRLIPIPAIGRFPIANPY